MKTITVVGVKHFVSEEHERKAEELGLDNQFIRTRLRNDWTVDEAHSAPKGMRLEDYREAINIERIQSKARQKRRELREQKLKYDKPHLFDGTPQQHSRGSYVSKLMSTSVFPKIRTDIFNNTQLV